MRRLRATTISSRLLRGLGQGEGEDYIPYLNRRNVPSHGRSSNLPLFNRRRHHATLSGHERRMALLLAWDDDVADFHEQYPLLPVSRTQLLAAARGITHPPAERISACQNP